MPKGISIVSIFLSVIVVIIIERILKGVSRIQVFGPSIAAKEFFINDITDSDILVRIQGRMTGIISWFLERFKLETEFNFIVKREGIYFDFSSITGRLKEFTPFTQITRTSRGNTKKVLLLEGGLLFTIIPLILLIGGILNFLWFSIPFLIGLVSFFIYAEFSEKMIIIIESTGSAITWIRFSKAVIEGKTLALDDAMKAIDVINKRLKQVNQNGSNRYKNISVKTLTRKSDVQKSDLAKSISVKNEVADEGSLKNDEIREISVEDNPLKTEYCVECGKPFTEVKRFETTNLCETCFNKNI